MYKIGQVADSTQISVETLRYYDREGIVSPSSRSQGGYRLYAEQDVASLHFLQRCKALGFTLQDITLLLSLKLDKSAHSCEEVKQVAAQQLDAIAKRMTELQRIHTALQTLHDKCCGGKESAEHCSILTTLESQDGGY